MDTTLHLFIVNPAAGKGLEQRTLPDRIRAVADGLGLEAEVYLPPEPGDAAVRVREAAASGNFVRVYACGGDGTVNEVVNAAAAFENVAVGVYPCGSGNDYIKSIPGGERCRDLVALMQGGIQKVDLLEVDGTLCCNMSNIGFDALVAHRMRLFRRIPLINGRLAYSLAVVAGLVSRMSWRMRAEFDGEEVLEGAYMFCAAGIGRVCGGKYMALPIAQIDDGLMDVCLLRQVPRIRFPGLIGIYQAGKHLEDPRVKDIVTYRRCHSMTLKLDHPAARAVDGEITKDTEFSLHVRPGALSLIVPA